MAMKESYYTIDGQMIGYKDQNGRKDFLTDALGSVTAEVDQTGNVKTFDGRYNPYGGDLSSTGSRGKYGWVGSWGYRETDLTASSHYVRARHFLKTSGCWTTGDKLWPEESAYSYAEARILSYVDYTGEDAGYPSYPVKPDDLDSKYYVGTPGCPRRGKDAEPPTGPLPSPCALWPGGPCAYAKAHGAFPPNVYGRIVCCDGSVSTCDNVPTSRQPGIIKCVHEHERRHTNDQDCPPRGYSLGGPVAPGGECAAYPVELNCLLRNLKKDCPIPSITCFNDYFDRISWVCHELIHRKCPTPKICSRFNKYP